MAELVISVFPNGDIQHTLSDEVFKPSTGGKREVKRMSEIVHDPETDCFYAQRMDGIPFFIEGIKSHLGVSGDSLTRLICGETIYEIPEQFVERADGKFPVYTSYKAAVAFEVRLINAYRLKGHPIPGFAA